MKQATFLIKNSFRTKYEHLREATDAPHIHTCIVHSKLYIFQLTEQAHTKLRALLILAFPLGFEKLHFSLPQSGSNLPHTHTHTAAMGFSNKSVCGVHNNTTIVCIAAGQPSVREIFRNHSPKLEHFTQLLTTFMDNYNLQQQKQKKMWHCEKRCMCVCRPQDD